MTHVIEGIAVRDGKQFVSWHFYGAIAWEITELVRDTAPR
jgi:hypothetical protein